MNKTGIEVVVLCTRVCLHAYVCAFQYKPLCVYCIRLLVSGKQEEALALMILIPALKSKVNESV